MASPGSFVCAASRSPYKVWNDEVSTRMLVDEAVSKTEGLTLGVGRIDGELLLHQHVAPELYVVLRGSGEMKAGDDRIDMRPGRFVFLPSGLRHVTKSINGPLDFAFVFPTSGLAGVHYDFTRRILHSGNPLVTGSLAALGSSNAFSFARERAHASLDFDGVCLRNAEAGAGHALHTHRVFYVTQGQGRVSIEGTQTPVAKGSYGFVRGGDSLQFQGGGSGLRGFVASLVPPARDGA